MAQYIYQTTLIKDETDVIGTPASNTTDVGDFEANHKSTCVPVTNINIAETAFVINKDYSDFDALVVSPFDWGDVRYVERVNLYDLYLITSEAL